MFKIISPYPQSCGTWLVHNPGADGTSKHCLRDLAEDAEQGRRGLSAMEPYSQN